MKMNRTLGMITLLAMAASSRGDTLYLKNGSSVDGTFMGRTSEKVKFKGPDGVTRAYAISDVQGLEFSEPPPKPADTGSSIVIPAGTIITVRTIDNIDSTQTSAGTRYRASIDDPVVVGNQVIIPRGADCTIQIAQLQENKELAIKLYDVVVGGRRYDVAANYAQIEAEGTSKTKKGVRRSVLLGGLGAAIGGIAGGGSAAAIGAVSGAGLGAISATMAKGKTLKVPAETRLTFQLRSPLPLS
jgi:hypothetical protein